MLELGFSSRQIETRLESGWLLPLRRDVYAVGHLRVGPRGRWMAAVLACGPDAVLSHESAACLWGLQGNRPLVDVNAGCGRQGQLRREGVRLHRCKLRRDERVEESGFPVTSVARTIFDLAEVVDYEQLKRTREEADRLKLLQLAELERVVERGRGRRALKPMRRLLAELRAPIQTRSSLEERFADFREAHRLPPPATNVLVLGHEVDALWPEAKLVVELDSWEFHAHRAAFQRDRARDSERLVAGYRTVRVTHDRLGLEAPTLLAELRALLGIANLIDGTRLYSRRMAVSSRFRVATVVAALALTVALLAGTTATAFTGPTGKLVAGAEERALRLHDLPPGYRIGDDSGCGPLGIEGAPPALANFVLENWPEGCGFQYEQLFRLPGAEPAPPLVESEVLALPSEQSSKAGFELLAGLIHDQTGKDAAKEILPPPAIGEVTRLFQTKSLVEGRPYRPSATVIWRQGTFVAELTVAGRSAAANERIALQLAQVQQARVLAPTPYTEAEQDDTEVALGNPKINFPIFWLGSTFEPGHGLASSKLEEVLLFSRSGEGPPGEKLALWYGGLNIDAWRPAGWRRFNRTVLGPLNQKWKCTKSTRLRLAHGHADVFAAYGRDFAVCPKRPPDRFYAIGHLGGMVVGVNLIYCTACMGPGSGPYNSLQAMKAVVRGLLRRPKPVF